MEHKSSRGNDGENSHRYKPSDLQTTIPQLQPSSTTSHRPRRRGRRRRLGPNATRRRRRRPALRRARRSSHAALAVANIRRLDVARVREAQRARAVDGETQRRRVGVERHAQALWVGLNHLA